MAKHASFKETVHAYQHPPPAPSNQGYSLLTPVETPAENGSAQDKEYWEAKCDVEKNSHDYQVYTAWLSDADKFLREKKMSVADFAKEGNRTDYEKYTIFVSRHEK